MDTWEEGFDAWTPSAPTSEETETDLDRAELLRLARELAERRQIPASGATAEIEQLKQSLRERAEAVAVRERELDELQRRLERPGIRGRIELRPKRGEDHEAVGGAALAARELATHERTRALAERERAAEAHERALQARVAELETEAERLAARELELDEELRAIETKLAETDAERRLAAAERQRLEERDRAVHEREKALAASRSEIDAERRRLEIRVAQLEAQAGVTGEQSAPANDGAAATVLAVVEEREQELARREATLTDRENELALVRRDLDADRSALLERERSLRHRDVAEVREPPAQRFVPPSFSEGLAALARSRPR
jgi:hypothetical protein